MKKIVIIDCNSFFCSCERLFRPDLKERPVGVLSNNDGCFISRTPELKKLGVPMGAPYFKYEKLCKEKNIAVFSANFALYTNISDRVMRVLRLYAPHMEVYSVDEAFLDLTDLKIQDDQAYLENMKKEIYQKTGIPVSIGMGSTKTLAKIANQIAKNNISYRGVLIINQNNIEQVLKSVPVNEIWGIGSRSSSKLLGLGIKTALQFRDYKNQKLILDIFSKTGRVTQEELKGVQCLKLNEELEKRKSIMSSRSFGSPVYDLKSLEESVASYASLAAQKLRDQKSICSGVMVGLRTSPHKDNYYRANKVFKFSASTNDTRKIISGSLMALKSIYQAGLNYQKASVSLIGIDSEDQGQYSFFSEGDDLESQNLMRVMDQINRREGSDTIKSLACGVNNKAWKMRQNFKSPRYVSGWTELPEVF